MENTTFSLLVPAINLRNGSTEAPVETVGLISAARTSIGGPALVQGQLTTHQAVPLAGRARLVDF